METLHAGQELHSILGRRSGGTPTGAWQVVSTGFQPIRNWDFDWYRDSSATWYTAVAVVQVAISDAEYAIISSQLNPVRGHAGVDISLYRLRKGGYYAFQNLELKVRTFVRKCPRCQLTSQIKPLVKAKKFTTTALYPFQVICADHIGPLPKDEEGYVRSHIGSNFFQLRPQLQKKLHAVSISTLVDGKLLIDFKPTMASFR